MASNNQQPSENDHMGLKEVAERNEVAADTQLHKALEVNNLQVDFA